MENNKIGEFVKFSYTIFFYFHDERTFFKDLLREENFDLQNGSNLSSCVVWIQTMVYCTNTGYSNISKNIILTALLTMATRNDL